MNILDKPLTMDYLRGLGANPHYNGLGVVKLPINSRYGYHFYSERAEIMCENVHEHRFNFRSTVLKGTLRNFLYTIKAGNPASSLIMEQGGCYAGSVKEIVASGFDLEESVTFDTSAGDSYWIRHDQLHKVQAVTNTVITFLEKEPTVLEHGRLIHDTENPVPCAFSAPKPASECWDIIEYTLNA